MKIIAVAALALIVGAVPAAAQMPPPPPGMPDAPPMHAPMFASLSEAGRATMKAAMRGADPRADRTATMAARDRMLTLLDADRLDVPALRRAMDDEREAANAAKARHQAAMISGFQQLSLADRKAFVADARAMKARMEARMAGWKEHRGGRGGRDMPPPPPQ